MKLWHVEEFFNTVFICICFSVFFSVYYMIIHVCWFFIRLHNGSHIPTRVGEANSHSGPRLASSSERTRFGWNCTDWIWKNDLGTYLIELNFLDSQLDTAESNLWSCELVSCLFVWCKLIKKIIQCQIKKNDLCTYLIKLNFLDSQLDTGESDLWSCELVSCSQPFFLNFVRLTLHKKLVNYGFGSWKQRNFCCEGKWLCPITLLNLYHMIKYFTVYQPEHVFRLTR